jgi:WD40 repeat protein
MRTSIRNAELDTGGRIIVVSGHDDMPNGPASARLKVFDFDAGVFRLPNQASWTKRVETEDPRRYAGYSLALSPQGDQFAIGGYGSVEIRDLSSGRTSQVIPTGATVTKALAYSPDGRLLAVADNRGGVALYDLNAQAFRFSRPEAPRGLTASQQSAYGHEFQVASLAFSADGRQLFSIGRENQLKVWDCDTGKLLRCVTVGMPSGWGDRSSVMAPIARNRLLIATMTGDVEVLDLTTGSILRKRTIKYPALDETQYVLQSMSLSRDGRVLAVAIGTAYHPNRASSTNPTSQPQGSWIVLWDLSDVVDHFSRTRSQSTP